MYSVNACTFDIHCNALFIKQVLPMFVRPHKPGVTHCTVVLKVFECSVLSISNIELPVRICVFTIR